MHHHAGDGHMEQISYIRVPTKNQNADCRLLEFQSYHIPFNRAYYDYQSGKNLNSETVATGDTGQPDWNADRRYCDPNLGLCGSE